MKILNIKAHSVLISDDNILVLASDRKDNISLLRIKWPKLSVENLYTFNGERSLLLTKLRDLYLISIDERLFVSRDLLEWRPVLRLKPGNTIWHAYDTPEGIVAQEYGELPTGLYTSGDGSSWARILANIDVDPISRHFHYVAYDPYRDLLYATLGDGNIVRAIAVGRRSWRAIYRGPWQFLPVVPLRDYVVFGFDSGIARGGVGIYRPEEGRWSFIFLKLERARYAQMAELIYTEGLYIAALGAPQAIVASRDLKLWYPLHVERYGESFNHHMSVREWGGIITCSTGSSLIVMKREEITLEGNPAMKPYTALIDRVRGLGFTLKRVVLGLGRR